MVQLILLGGLNLFLLTLISCRQHTLSLPADHSRDTLYYIKSCQPNDCLDYYQDQSDIETYNYSLSAINRIYLTNLSLRKFIKKRCKVNKPPVCISNNIINSNTRVNKLYKNVCLIISRSLLEEYNDSTYKYKLKKIDNFDNIILCKDDYFKNKYGQLKATGTGIAINDSTVITAAHNITNGYDTSKFLIFVNFVDSFLRNDSIFFFNKKNVYFSSNKSIFTSSLDIALCRLTRKNYSVKNIDTSHTFRKDEKYYSLGFPLGSPLSYHCNGDIEILNDTLGVTNLNVFSGNSGSPIFSYKDNKLIGIVTEAPSCQILNEKINCCYRSRNTCKKMGLSAFNLISNINKINN